MWCSAYIKPLMQSAQSSELSDPPTGACALSPPHRDLLDYAAKLITAAPLFCRRDSGMNYHLLCPPLCGAVTPLYQVTRVYAALGEPLSHFRRRETFL